MVGLLLVILAKGTIGFVWDQLAKTRPRFPRRVFYLLSGSRSTIYKQEKDPRETKNGEVYINLKAPIDIISSALMM